MNDLSYLIGFSMVSGFGPAAMRLVRAHFGSPGEAWRADMARLTAAGIDLSAVKQIMLVRENVDLSRAEEGIRAMGVSFVTESDPHYPELLKEIPYPPFLLYVRGTPPRSDWCAIALVGTRQMTSYGQAMATLLSSDLSRKGFVTVSGLARGVDTVVHESTLKAGGVTVAVIGSGVDHHSIYPSENKELSRCIIEQGGCVLSEFPPHTPPLKHHFPLRNRIIAGMSLATVVVEADIRSGSLITAQSALECNREVFAVPGPVTSQYSLGPNSLLKQGAHVATCADDICEVLALFKAALPLPSRIDARTPHPLPIARIDISMAVC